jgi:lipid A 3-O-deacylase
MQSDTLRRCSALTTAQIVYGMLSITWTFVSTAAAQAPAAASAQSPAVSAVLQLEIDNDLFAVRGSGPPPDYDYTHGTHLSYSWNHSSVALAQEIFTPRHNAPSPVPGDRPYAAWLFGEYGYRRPAGSWLTTLTMRAGVTGPAALGEQVQNNVHRLLGNHLEEGWSHQLPTRLTLALRADETRLLVSGGTPGPSRQLAATLGGTLGTIQRSVHGGLQSYLGFGAVRSATANAPLVERQGQWYIVAAYREDYVFYDAFLESAPRNANVSAAQLRPLVAEAAAGVGWRTNRFAAEYRYVVRGREYEAEPGAHPYGAIRLSMIAG